MMTVRKAVRNRMPPAMDAIYCGKAKKQVVERCQYLARKCLCGRFFPTRFTFSLKGNISLRNIEDSQYGNAEIGAYKDTGFISKINQEYKEYTLQQLLAWKHQFGRHFVEWMVGHENYDYKLNFDAIQKRMRAFPE